MMMKHSILTSIRGHSLALAHAFKYACLNLEKIVFILSTIIPRIDLYYSVSFSCATYYLPTYPAQHNFTQAFVADIMPAKYTPNK